MSLLDTDILTLLLDQAIETILDGVLVTRAVEHLRDLGPLLAALQNECKEVEILLIAPRVTI
jgi:hypothetical protein